MSAGEATGPGDGGDDTPAIELSGLTKYYGDIRGIEELTLSVDHGEVFGFLGPNGAGKSTAIRTLLGFLAPTSGSATLLGHRITDRRARLAVLSEVGYLPSDVAFYDGVTGRRLLDYLQSLRGGERRAELEARFPAPFDRRIETYSRGNRQKLGLVQAFMHDPSLVVMDEPTSGLDPIMQNAFYDFLDAERDRGVTALFSSHVLSEVRRVCDRVAVIRDGRLVTVEAIDDLLEKSGKVVTVALAESPPPETFAVDGVANVERLDAGDGDENRYRLLVTANYDGLLAVLTRYHVHDIEIRETSLDDVFLHFYTDDADGTGSTDSTGDTSAAGTTRGDARDAGTTPAGAALENGDVAQDGGGEPDA
jgi:ABC-2 type transport system ATP-binding protein